MNSDIGLMGEEKNKKKKKNTKWLSRSQVERMHNVCSVIVVSVRVYSATLSSWNQISDRRRVVHSSTQQHEKNRYV